MVAVVDRMSIRLSGPCSSVCIGWFRMMVSVHLLLGTIIILNSFFLFFAKFLFVK